MKIEFEIGDEVRIESIQRHGLVVRKDRFNLFVAINGFKETMPFRKEDCFPSVATINGAKKS